MHTLKITKKETVFKNKTVYDIQVKDTNSYLLANGVISHNSIGGYGDPNVMCLSEDTLIKTEKGVSKIGSIVVGDKVETLFGLKEVDLINYFDEEIFEMNMEDGSSILATSKHKFLVNGNWICVSDLATLVDVNKNINISAITDVDNNVYKEQILQNLPTYDA